MSQKRESSRIKANQRKVLDEATRKLRLEKSHSALEQDNNHEDSHPDMKLPKRGPKHEDSSKKGRRQKPKTEPLKMFRKNFTALLEDERDDVVEGEKNYITKRMPNKLTMSQKRESSRIKEANQRKVLDEATRKLRLEKSHSALEQDNHHEDPHPDMKLPKREPKLEDPSKKVRRQEVKIEPLKMFKKKYTPLLKDEENYFVKSETNYATATVPPFRYPPTYTCVKCGARYHCIRCVGIHKDKGCLKLTAKNN